jgi:uncharacterized NAD-dependent epimerase/dehydratase family protein
MSSTSGIGSAQQTALGGIRSQIARFNKAATEVVRFGAEHHNAAVVNISDAARAQASEVLGADLEGALIESKEAGAGLAANVRVLQTANDMNKELIDMFGRR